MAASQSVIFEANAAQIWQSVVKLIATSGHPIIKTDEAAKQITYQANRGSWIAPQSIVVSVTAIDDNTTNVSILTKATDNKPSIADPLPAKLINYVINGLTQRYPLAENQPKAATGTSGCVSMLLSVVLSIVVIVVVGSFIK